MNKKSSLFMTEKQEKTFGPEGSNPNPEIYEGIKNNESSPLQSAYESGAGGMVYASDRDSFQNMFNQLTSATVNLVNKRKDPKAVADRLEKRVERRTKRADKKGKATTKRTVDLGPNPLEGELPISTYPYSSADRKISVTIKGDAKRDKFDSKTNKIKGRLAEAKEKARQVKEQKIKDAAAMRGTKTPQQKALDKEVEIVATYELRNPGKKYLDLTDKEKQKFMFNNRFTQSKPE
jgi:hypothetical protein